MKHLLTILAALILCAPAQAQTLKALMVNTTNGHIVATNNDLRFTNAGAVIATSFEAGEMIVSSSGIRTTEFGGQLNFDSGELIANDTTVFSFSGEAFILNQPVSFTSPASANTSRTNLGATTIGSAIFTAANATAARQALGLGATNLVSFKAVEAAQSVLGSLATNTTIDDLSGFQFRDIGGNSVNDAAWYARYPGTATVAFAMGQPSKDIMILQPSQITFTTNVFMKGALSFEAFDPGLAQYNDYAAITRTNLGLGATWLTNTDVTNFRSAIGLGATNDVEFDDIKANDIEADEVDALQGTFGNATDIVSLTSEGIDFTTNTMAATTRTNLGLGWSALTNTNTANALIGYNTTNNVVVQPTTPAAFDFGALGIRADVAEFGRGSGTIGFNTNGRLIFYTTNSGFSFGAGASAAQLRSDLGLGATWLTNTNDTNFRTAIGLGATNNVKFKTLILGSTTNTLGNYDFYAPKAKFDEIAINGRGLGLDEFGNFTLYTSLHFGNTADAATTRTNLGLGATWLTNPTAPSGVTTNAGELTAGTLADARLSTNVVLTTDSRLTNARPLSWVSVPASPTNSGTAGQIAYTNNYLYIAISNNTWRRVQLGTW